MSEKLYEMSDLCLEIYVNVLYNITNGRYFVYILPQITLSGGKI